MNKFVMSLPPSYQEPETFVEDSLSFYERYKHLFHFANLHILVNKCLDQIPLDGFEDVDLFDETFDLEANDLNSFTREFIEKSAKLTVDYGEIVSEEELVINAPLSVKKRHEISQLAKEIQTVCDGIGCSTVVDFGSGLGYLDQLVYERSNYNVLGIECNSQHYVGAKKRQKRYHENSNDKVKYVRHEIDENSHVFIQETLADKFSKEHSFCVVGLHACADLAVTAILVFLKMAAAKSLILMPCCYHRMEIEINTENCVRFKNFPLSETVRTVYERYKGFQFMQVPFLRLAVQPPYTAVDLRTSTFSLLARGLLQLYANTYNYKLTRKRRKAVKTSSVGNNIENYIKQINDGFSLTCRHESCASKCSCNIEFDHEIILQLWRENCTDLTFRRAAIFILLQKRLQRVFENFVLYDRILFLKENGLDNCRVKKVVNENLSPRCLSLIVYK